MKKFIPRLLSFLFVLGMLLVPVQSAMATSTNDDILTARNGILQVMVSGKGADGNLYNLFGGTGFLVGTEDNAQTIITNHHVVHPLDYETADSTAQIRTYLGLGENDKLELSIRVVVKRDVYINATILNESAEADFAILKMEQPIYNRRPLTLNLGTVQSTEEIYALGFPQKVQYMQADEIYTSDDVTVTSGIVSKTTDVQLISSPIPCITHSATITGGNSGGPLLDHKGNVIAINRHSDDVDSNSKYFYSVKINEVWDVLDALGIPVNTTTDSLPVTSESVETAPETIAEEKNETETLAQTDQNPLLDELKLIMDSADQEDLSNKTQDSAENFRNALNAAEAAYRNKSVSENELKKVISDLETAQKGLVVSSETNKVAIILLAAAAIIVIIIIVVIIIVVNSKKKKRAATNHAQQKQRMPGAQNYGSGQMHSSGNSSAWNQPSQPQGNYSQGNSYTGSMNNQGDGASETSVLNQGATETTLLSMGRGMPSANLVRKKNNERITINKQIFKIGKERRRVDYCIMDNSNISRSHAEIIFKNGEFYIVDNNATNGTMVNGTTVMHGQEYKLANGDTIGLADEEFVFQK